MNSFRKALSKIDAAYSAGIGRASYSAVEDIRLTDVFNKHYDGSQRLRLSASSSVFWDNDVYAADEDDVGLFYYSINGEEVSLPSGGSVTVEDVQTIPFIQTHGATDIARFDGSGASTYSRQGSTTETVTTTLEMSTGDDRVITQTEQITEDSVWFTPGE